MRKIVGVALLLVSLVVNAQDFDAANFSIYVSKTKATVGETIVLSFTTSIPDGLHIYAVEGDCQVGPKKPWFEDELTLTDCEFVGSIYDGIKPHVYEDDLFNCMVSDFAGKADFKQKLKITGPNPAITGEFWYQMCSDARCKDFGYAFTLPKLTVSGKPIKQTEPVPDKTEKQVAPETDPGASGSEIPEVKESSTIDNKAIEQLMNCLDCDEKLDNKGAYVNADEVDYSSYQKRSEADADGCVEKTFEGQTDDDSFTYWGFFILAFLSGLLALLTPCVFPMIPMTVSFFMKDGSRAKAIRSGLIYAFSIVAIYVVIGTLVAATAGEDAAHFLSTHWLPNVFFFLIFVVFAASFFGAFELTLPSSLVNKVDKQADKGGLTGIFFMAFTIVLVSFSCTGPIVGSILVESAGGQFVKPLVGMLGYSLAFAIPFGLFAIFPNWLNNLPQSGGWLNTVKVVLGFLELAFGLKFLSIADQTYHWGILDREVYLALWIVIFTLMGIYLLGKIKFAHDSETKFVSVPKLLMAILTFSFVAYLIPGLVGAPLNQLAGYLPPMSTHDFDLIGTIKNPHPKESTVKYGDKLHAPHGIEAYFDYEEGMEAARISGKPVFLDFTGWGCVNCREMEARVWSDNSVLRLLKDDYIVISLYTDDKTIRLPEDEWYYSKATGKQIKRLDKKNADIESCFFGESSQPLYVLLDNKGNMLQPKRGHNLDVAKYTTFLRKGVKEYEKRVQETK